MRKPQYCTFRLVLFLHTYPSLLKFLPVLPHEELHPALSLKEATLTSVLKFKENLVRNFSIFICQFLVIDPNPTSVTYS